MKPLGEHFICAKYCSDMLSLTCANRSVRLEVLYILEEDEGQESCWFSGGHSYCPTTTTTIIFVCGKVWTSIITAPVCKKFTIWSGGKVFLLFQPHIHSIMPPFCKTLLSDCCIPDNYWTSNMYSLLWREGEAFRRRGALLSLKEWTGLYVGGWKMGGI